MENYKLLLKTFYGSIYPIISYAIAIWTGETQNYSK